MIGVLDNSFKTGAARCVEKPRPPLMTDEPQIETAVLEANEAFYSAFARGDFDAMGDIWGKAGPIAVEHPGSARTLGRGEVLQSWRMILRAPPPITATVEDVIADEDQWAVICQEDLGRVVLRMVNVFHQEDGVWKMIYHGPAPDRRLSS